MRSSSRTPGRRGLAARAHRRDRRRRARDQRDLASGARGRIGERRAPGAGAHHGDAVEGHGDQALGVSGAAAGASGVASAAALGAAGVAGGKAPQPAPSASRAWRPPRAASARGAVRRACRRGRQREPLGARPARSITAPLSVQQFRRRQRPARCRPRRRCDARGSCGESPRWPRRRRPRPARKACRRCSRNMPPRPPRRRSATTSTTACWNEAHRSATSASVSGAIFSASSRSAVFKPDSEKSQSIRAPVIGRGSAKRDGRVRRTCRLPSSTSAGPPG